MVYGFSFHIFQSAQKTITRILLNMHDIDAMTYIQVLLVAQKRWNFSSTMASHHFWGVSSLQELKKKFSAGPHEHFHQ
jgi:hypothetical protein